MKKRYGEFNTSEDGGAYAKTRVLPNALRWAPVLLVALILAACDDTANQINPGTTHDSTGGGQKGSATQASSGNSGTSTAVSGATGIKKIDHVVIIAQENHSFDTYFGTFPGAKGFPMQNGKPTVCSNDPDRRCGRKYPSSAT